MNNTICECGHEIDIHDEHTTGCRVATCHCIAFMKKENTEISLTRHVVRYVSSACHAVVDQTIDTIICYCPKSEYASRIVEALNTVDKLDKERLKISQMEVTV